MPWFESWFNSHYYHILYQHRNERDAEVFLDHLLEYLKPVPGSSMLDLGCGKGRHSVYLNNKGYTVTGIDLSEESIQYCRNFENNTLSFFVHDMRRLFRVNDFDYVFNLFTSFGYFEKDSENMAAIKNACNSLKKGGRLVIDFLNSTYVRNHLVNYEEIELNNIRFRISRVFENGFFLKDIRFSDQGQDFHYTEKVAGLTLADFERYLLTCGMKIENLSGNYDLQPFNEASSPRLIITATKN
jgi:SAM-dependent methyltransferase